MPEPKPTPFYADKPFITVILTPVLVILAKKLGVPLNTEEIIGFVASVVGFVVMAKWAGAKKAEAAAEGEREALKIKTASEALQSLAQAAGGTVEIYQPGKKTDVQ